jgi:hypothetical protein
MKFGVCPYCELPGFVTTVKGSTDGLQVSGKCWTCGYTSGRGAEDGSNEIAQESDPRPVADCCGD